MFRSCFVLWTKVPFYTLFQHNHVLKRVFSAQPSKEALVFENPGVDPVRYTYGDIQQDVIGLADIMVSRQEAIAKESNETPLSWLQSPRSPDIRSVYAEGDGPVSSDVLTDCGTYNTATLASHKYSFVVSLLSAWALNQMAVPLSVSQKYRGELAYVLEHSKCPRVLGEREALKERLPEIYDPLYLSTVDDIARPRPLPCQKPAIADGQDGGCHSVLEESDGTYNVETVFDVKSLLDELRRKRSCSRAATQPPLDVEFAEPSGVKRPLRDAEDVLHRLEQEKVAKARRDVEREAEKRYEQFIAPNQGIKVDNEQIPVFDDRDLSSMNAVFRRWYRDPVSRPGPHDDCLMIYTSGTTARPKGAVHTHKSVSSMVRVLQDAWMWTSEDRILELLPLHHIHGLVNILLCSLASHSTCVMTPFDNPIRVARRIERGDITLLMAVPTVYTKLIAGINKEMSPIEKTGFRKVVSQHVRLMVSGSAALPVPTLQQFKELSGHILLERYGMTEVGMALSQPLRPTSRRLQGTVGSPLPAVDVFVHRSHAGADEKGSEEGSTSSDGEKSENAPITVQYAEIGQLAISSASLFDRYWANPDATKKELVVTANGKRYFETGDTVGVLPRSSPSEDPVFAILGRSSVDILKSRGYKISALEIEGRLLERKDLFAEVVIVGIPDPTLGDALVAVIAPKSAAVKAWNLPNEFRQYESANLNKKLSIVAHELLAHYKCPARYIIVPSIPRNPTGKVNKKSLVKELGLV